jgi:hypothetical protein
MTDRDPDPAPLHEDDVPGGMSPATENDRQNAGRDPDRDPEAG